MSHIDVDRRTHELDPNVLDVTATRLEARRNSERYISMLYEYLDHLGFPIIQRSCFQGVVQVSRFVNYLHSRILAATSPHWISARHKLIEANRPLPKKVSALTSDG